MLHALLSIGVSIVAQVPDSSVVLPPEVTQQVNVLLLALIGAVSSAILGIAKVISVKIAGLPDILKSILFGAISVVAVLVARVLHIDPTSGLSLFVESGVVALLGMGLRAIVHALGLDQIAPNAA